MWSKAGILVVALVAFAAPAKALLVDGSFKITLTGEKIVPSPGTFDVIGSSVVNFTMDLFSNNDGPDRFSTYSTDSTLEPSNFGTVLEGDITNDWHAGFGIIQRITFTTEGTWVCIGVSGCATNSFFLELGDRGSYTISPEVSAVPLPAAVWLFLSALGGLGLFGWRKRRADA
ncbi:MAG: VPLPA-CTERM sorting domain-containing protein [Alphaproteobacteria bacterium]|nr:VPLPA-CTERM sorting domain-containing protein [Alphaproteobacteria bacterium]